MATERQSPDAILASTNLTGAVGAIQDDPDSPDGNWLTATSDGSDTMVRVSFPTPTGDPTTGAGLQEFRWWCRNTANGGGSDPTYVIHLYENGSDLGQIASGSVASGTGEIISATWNASSLGTSDGSLVEAYIYGTVVKKDSLEIGAVEWNVTYDTGTTHEGAGSSAGVATATATGATILVGAGSSAGVATATATGNIVWLGAGQSDGVATATATGGLDLFGAGQSDGLATATATGTTATVHEGAGTSAGLATATATGDVEHTGAGQSDGLATATATGNVDWIGAGLSDGLATATGTAAAIIQGAGQSDGVATATATGDTGTTHEGAGTSAGVATATAAGDVEHTGAGQSDGVATATATGSFAWFGEVQSDGLSTVPDATANVDWVAAGQSAGTSTATGTYGETVVGVVTNVPWQDTTKMGVYLELGPAPAGGAVFTLSIKAGEVARITFPATVTIPAGETGKQFDVTWLSEGATILEAQLTEYNGVPRVGTVFERDVYCLSYDTEQFISVRATVEAETDPVNATVEVGP